MLDLISEIEKKRQENGRPKPLKIQFNLHLKSIQKALDSGYSKKETWEILKEKKLFNGSYIMFSKYCKDIVNKNSKTETRKEPKRYIPQKNKTFNFDPMEDKRYLLERATDD